MPIYPTSLMTSFLFWTFYSKYVISNIKKKEDRKQSRKVLQILQLFKRITCLLFLYVKIGESALLLLDLFL